MQEQNNYPDVEDHNNFLSKILIFSSQRKKEKFNSQQF